MFQCGDMVLYGIHGVCRILDVETRTVDRKKIPYFVLEPLEQAGARYYIPCENEAALSKLSHVLTRDELDRLLRSDQTRRDLWIPDENKRKQQYRELISSGDRASLICMIRSLRRHKEEQLAAGRKFHLSDEGFLRDAEKILSAEFSLVLGIEPADVGAYIEMFQQ